MGRGYGAGQRAVEVGRGQQDRGWGNRAGDGAMEAGGGDGFGEGVMELWRGPWVLSC